MGYGPWGRRELDTTKQPSKETNGDYSSDPASRTLGAGSGMSYLKQAGSKV